MIRVVIVDDHVAIRKMLRVFLERETGYVVVGETASGLEAIRLCTDLRPDLVILDLMLLELSGSEAMIQIREQSPTTRILVYSGTQNLAVIRRCLQVGPDGFVEKFDDINMLREGLKAVTAGHKFLTGLLNKLRHGKLDLTEREVEVLQLIAEGKFSKKITTPLDITKRPVDFLQLMVLKKSSMNIASHLNSSIDKPPSDALHATPMPQKKNVPKFVQRTLKMILIVVAAFVCLLFFNQHRLIWLPRHYTAGQESDLPKNTVTLDYTTSQGKQRSYYIPPSSPGVAVPDHVWVLFCGNGSLALDWLDVLLMAPNKNDGFLLFDYPGYGRCKGSATPGSIKESSEAALSQLALHLKMPSTTLDSKLNVLAHSIGCAAGLEFAARHPVREIILLSPFTTLRDMARRTVGWPLCWLLRHNFDNRARLAELAARPAPPRVTIFHGADDTLIPPQMSRSLADTFPKMITFHEVPNAGHNTIVEIAETQIFAVIKD